MKFSRKQLKIILIHLALWFSYILYESFLLLFANVVGFNYWETGLNFLLYAGLFYSRIALLALDRRSAQPSPAQPSPPPGTLLAVWTC